MDTTEPTSSALTTKQEPDTTESKDELTTTDVMTRSLLPNTEENISEELITNDIFNNSSPFLLTSSLFPTISLSFVQDQTATTTDATSTSTTTQDSTTTTSPTTGEVTTDPSTTETSAAIVQWGEWGDWSEWAPSCFDDSSDSIYQDTDNYYPKHSRTRDCIKTENGVKTTVAVNDASGNCPFNDKIETIKNKTEYTTGRV